MKKIIKYVFTGASLLLGANACTDILDTAPHNALATSTMWTTDASVDQGVAGVYAALRDWGLYSSIGTGINNSASQNGSTWSFEIWGMSGQANTAGQSGGMSNGSLTVGSGIFSDTWKKLYEGVHRANDAIVNIPQKSPASAEKNARLVAEAKFLRAYFYFRLNELFGRDGLGVPLYTEPLASADDATKGQSSEADIWAQIVNDLTDCINEPNLPDKTSNGRISKGAAYALRGKAYLYQGAKYANDGAVTKDDALLNKAVADFAQVQAAGYALFQGGYKVLFKEANEKSDEMIFSIQHDATRYYGHIVLKYCGARGIGAPIGGNGWGDYFADPHVVDLYENTDGSAFDWDVVIPGYSAMDAKDRAVYFLRDTLDAAGNPVYDTHASWNSIKGKIRTMLSAASPAAQAAYLPYGNEDRIKAAYANRDPRLAANVITPYSVFLGSYSFANPNEAMDVVYRWPINAGNDTPNKSHVNDFSTDRAGDNGFQYYHRKFVAEGTEQQIREDCPIDEPLIRYANVLLWWAEALVELNDLSGAEAKVAEVRSRTSVAMPTPSAAFANQAAARNYVRDERRREFVNEGVNFFDEIRWRTLKQTKFDGGNTFAYNIWGAVSGAGSYTWGGDKLYIWPVPRTEVEKNSNLTPTPGWDY
ncbi:hypothetical protein AGMMS4957_07660 [Bacteroidia bacterium]|nr:hypothetical protein AGMMS4957_07660 [Bacteroidia bacterium]